MGFFSFVKSVGKKLGIGDEETPPNAEDLKKELDSYDLGSDGLVVEVDGDTAVIKGEVADQSIFEKAILAVGNTLGISNVEAGDVKLAGAAKAGDPVFYEVKKGDNFGRLPRPITARARAPNIRRFLKPTNRCSNIQTKFTQVKSCAFRH